MTSEDKKFALRGERGFCGFSKNVFSEGEGQIVGFFMTFNIVIRYNFPENVIELVLVVQKIRYFY